MTMADREGFTVKELVLQMAQDVRGLDGKMDAFIVAHQALHTTEIVAAIEARSNPGASPAGRTLMHDIDELANMVRAHDRAFQRVHGALALVTFLGGAAFVTTLLRLVGVVAP